MKNTVKKPVKTRTSADPAADMKEIARKLRKVLKERKKSLSEMDKTLAQNLQIDLTYLSELKKIGSAVKKRSSEKVKARYAQTIEDLKVHAAMCKDTQKNYAVVDRTLDKIIGLIDDYLVDPLDSLSERIEKLSQACLVSFNAFVNKMDAAAQTFETAENSLKNMLSMIMDESFESKSKATKPARKRKG